MSVKVRFAPSPTGKLHVGNVRTALVNWLFAKGQGGSFVLRIDDTDLVRSTQESEDNIEIDLKWLGLTWDERYNQSKRFDRYEEAAARLKADGRLYPCYETADELDRRRKVQLSRGQPPIYDRAALQPGNRIAGPAIVTEFDSTTVILAGYEAEVDRFFNIVIRPEGQS